MSAIIQISVETPKTEPSIIDPPDSITINKDYCNRNESDSINEDRKKRDWIEHSGVALHDQSRERFQRRRVSVPPAVQRAPKRICLT